MSEQYRVAWYLDDTYQVLNRQTDEQLYQGRLADCEAFIRLQEGGYF